VLDQSQGIQFIDGADDTPVAVKARPVAPGLVIMRLGARVGCPPAPALCLCQQGNGDGSERLSPAAWLYRVRDVAPDVAGFPAQAEVRLILGLVFLIEEGQCRTRCQM
jgi:hypothetical protein